LDPEPFFLSEEHVLGIHSEQIEKFGGATGLVEPNLLSSAVEGQQRWNSQNSLEI
jgi:hypothetical protein